MNVYMQTIDAIELCSIYSAALYNPKRSVIVHYRGQLRDDIVNCSRQLNNIQLRQIEDDEICSQTPIAAFYLHYINHTLCSHPPYAVVELSDIIRLCIIYRFGGTYADTDFIWINPIPVCK